MRQIRHPSTPHPTLLHFPSNDPNQHSLGRRSPVAAAFSALTHESALERANIRKNPIGFVQSNNLKVLYDLTQDSKSCAKFKYLYVHFQWQASPKVASEGGKTEPGLM